jgi:alkyl hydroperoxide reductase subunit AhpC
MPDLDRLQATFGDRGLTVLHVSTERVEVLDGWLAEHTMSTLFGKIGPPPFPTPALPTSLVLDREGIVRHVLVGGTSYGRFEKAVEPWL